MRATVMGGAGGLMGAVAAAIVAGAAGGCCKFLPDGCGGSARVSAEQRYVQQQRQFDERRRRDFARLMEDPDGGDPFEPAVREGAPGRANANPPRGLTPRRGVADPFGPDEGSDLLPERVPVGGRRPPAEDPAAAPPATPGGPRPFVPGSSSDR